MKNIFFLPIAFIFFACNNSKNENNAAGTETKPANTDQPASSKPAAVVPVASSGTKVFVDGKEMNLSGSLLVQKDKEKLQPGAEYLVMLTSSGSTGEDGLVLNFLMGLKTGSYPIVGMSFRRGTNPKNEMYGGLLGGKPKLTDYKVNITDCKDLGSNNLGGHKWSISGDFGELIIPAMSIMLMDKTKNHPAAIKIEKGSFSNLTFDDNWEEMMKQMTDKMKK